MLKTIDAALAGAIDVIADDVQLTVKSLREQGVRRTLGDAVEDAAGLVKTGAGAVLSNVVGGRKGPEKISNHAGVSSSYADLCAGPGGGLRGSGGAIFPYTPGPGATRGSAKVPAKTTAGSFAPGIGIQRAAQAPFPPMPAQAPFPPMPGPARPQPYAAAPPFLPMPTTPAPAPSTSAPSAAAGGKEAPLPAHLLAARFEEIKKRHPANDRCFDCGAATPEWASVSFGVFLCIECCGYHRQLGTHITRIRSCKMDSWTEKQLQVFDHSGNARMAEFFAANGVTNNVRFQRYQTLPAEWYRESWIKNRIFGRPVPPPPEGVVAGPCVDNSAPAKAPEAKKATPPADLLDFGGASSAAASKAAPQADLLGFGDGPAQATSAAPANTDLLGVSGSTPAATAVAPGGGDLLGLGGDSELLGLAATAAKARPPAATLAGLDFGSVSQPLAAPQPAAAPALAQPVPAALPPAAPAMQAGVAPWPAANTLGGGAKLADAPREEKPMDPFAMALEKWGM